MGGGGGVHKNQYTDGNYLESGAWTVCRFKGGAWQKRGGGVCEEGGWYPNSHYDGKNFCQFSLKCHLKNFFSKICWQNSAKASSMYQQWTAAVLIFLKIPTTDSLVFFSEYISRTAIFKQASVIICQ